MSSLRSEPGLRACPAVPVPQQPTPVASTRVIAVDMPNNQYANAQSWYDYRTSVDEIEAATGLDFLDALPTDLQEVLEVHFVIARLCEAISYLSSSAIPPNEPCSHGSAKRPCSVRIKEIALRGLRSLRPRAGSR